MNKYKLKILSVYKMIWIYCNFFDFSTDGIVFKKEGDNTLYFIDGKYNKVLYAYEKIGDKWIKFYDWNTTYGKITKGDKK
ncbi:MAG: hypothetical protein IKE95_03780 [Methanobrevibacter sp.]|nr:hypothetical protein [Methanobrevibacter sp.]